MKIHEYQAKKIFKDYGVPVPKGIPIFNVEDVEKVAVEIGGRVVVKAQIHAGGRGKGGGVKLAKDAAEARKYASQILGMTLVTHQTGAHGKLVKRLLIEEAIDIKRELYLAILLDREACRPVIIASEAGGMDIEKVAAETPEKIIKEHVDPRVGVQAFQARKIAFALNFEKDQVQETVKLIIRLYKIFLEKDCSLIEINPLVVTNQGRILAADAKIGFDDNALYRHGDIVEMRDLDEEEPLEVEASNNSLSYVKLNGEVGCMVNGAGLAMATMDIIKLAGAEPANFLDVGGTASAERVEHAFKIILADKNVKAILINIYGGIVRCDRVANGVVQAAKNTDIKVPIVVRLTGTNSKEANEILDMSGLDLLVARDFGHAAECVIKALGKKKIN